MIGSDHWDIEDANGRRHRVRVITSLQHMWDTIHLTVTPAERERASSWPAPLRVASMRFRPRAIFHADSLATHESR